MARGKTSEPKTGVSAYVKTWDDLAAALGISRPGLRLVRARHAAAPDLPKIMADGRHHVERWRVFFQTHGIEGRAMDNEATDSTSDTPAAWKARLIEQQVIKATLANELTKREQVPMSEIQVKLSAFLMTARTQLDQLPPDLSQLLEGIDDFSERVEIIQTRLNRVLELFTGCPWLDEQPIQTEETKP